LSGGEIAGIFFGVFLFAALMILLITVTIRRHRQQKALDNLELSQQAAYTKM
jgi:hypothetical protein